MSPSRPSFLRRLAALAALPGRPGSQLPGASTPLLSAPDASAPATRAPEGRAEGSRLRRSLRASVAEGVFAELVTACAGGAVLTGWALHLGAGPLAVGLLGALPFLAQLVQLPSAWVTAVAGRRRVALVAVALSRQVLLPLAALPFLPLDGEAKRAVLLAVAAASAVLGVVGNNAWVAWMGALVPASIRGRYFGRRTALITLGGTAGSLLAGLGLDAARARGLEGEALASLAILASAAGLAATLLMRRQHEPDPDAGRETLAYAAALAPYRDPVARPYLGYQVAWNAAVGLSASFYNVHMLENLGLGFTWVAAYGTAVAAIRILTAPLWGAALDRVGARPILAFSSFGIAAIPLLWLLPTREAPWLLAFEPLLSGSLWCGHALAAFQLPLRVAPARGRPFYLASFATAGGLAFGAASVAGGLLAAALPAHLLFAGRPFLGLHLVFVASAAARLAAAFLSVRVLDPGAHPVRALVELAGAGAARLPSRTTAFVSSILPRR